MTTQTGRLFFALWPDEHTAQKLVHAQAVLQGGRRTHLQDMHLTLAFLGVQPSERLEALKSVVHDIDFAAMEFSVDCYGEFPRQKVVWAGMTHIPPALSALRLRLLDHPALAGLSFRREAQFVPHLTLARKAPLPQAPFAPFSWRAGRIALAEGTGEQAGPRYRLLACRDV